jgi:hypothetical protein
MALVRPLFQAFDYRSYITLSSDSKSVSEIMGNYVRDVSVSPDDADLKHYSYRGTGNSKGYFLFFDEQSGYWYVSIHNGDTDGAVLRTKHLTAPSRSENHGAIEIGDRVEIQSLRQSNISTMALFTRSTNNRKQSTKTEPIFGKIIGAKRMVYMAQFADGEREVFYNSKQFVDADDADGGNLRNESRLHEKKTCYSIEHFSRQACLIVGIAPFVGTFVGALQTGSRVSQKPLLWIAFIFISTFIGVGCLVLYFIKSNVGRSRHLQNISDRAWLKEQKNGCIIVLDFVSCFMVWEIFQHLYGSLQQMVLS